jgi:hypothetical protein
MRKEEVENNWKIETDIREIEKKKKMETEGTRKEEMENKWKIETVIHVVSRKVGDQFFPELLVVIQNR